MSRRYSDAVRHRNDAQRAAGFLKATEIAEALGVTAPAVMYWVKTGRIQAIKVGLRLQYVDAATLLNVVPLDLLRARGLADAVEAAMRRRRRESLARPDPLPPGSGSGNEGKEP